MTTVRRLRARADASGTHSFRPVQLVEVDLDRPLPAVTGGTSPAGEPYGSAQVLVRRTGTPIGLLTVALTAEGIPAATLADRLDAELGSGARHRRPVGLAPATPAAAAAVVELASASSLSTPAATTAPTASVVVTSRNSMDDLDRLLDALLADDDPGFEVIVVDNRPQDPRLRALVDGRRASEPRLRYLREPRPGRSWARNTGYSLSRAELVAFTDDDCVPDPGWLRGLVAAFAEHPMVACVTGPVLALELDHPGQVELDDATRVTGNWERRRFDLGAHRDDAPVYPFVPGLFGSGVNMAVRKSLLPDLWGFDVNLGPDSAGRSADDLDVFIDVLFAGRQILFEPRALVRRRYPADPVTVQQRLRDHDIGTAAMLTKQLLADSAKRGALVRLAPAGMFAPIGARTGRPSDRTRRSRRPPIARVLDLATGPVAYARSRLRHSWMTA